MQRMNPLEGAFVRHFATALAASLLAGSAVVSLAHAQAQQAGVTAAVRGNVEIASAPGAVGKLVKSGEAVYLGNAIKSGPNSGLQILLLDQTTFTIGPDSEITIDKFVFDPEKGAGKVSASVAKGVFRFVTGKVAQTNPSDMEVKLPVGTIGIRGTIAMGSVGGEGSPLGTQIVLVGPGKDHEGNNRAGGLNLTGNTGGQQNIDRPGFGSMFGQGGWGVPQFFTPEMMGALQGRLIGFTTQGQGGQQGQQDQGQGGQATQNAGANQTQGKNDANNTNGLSGLNTLNQQLIGGSTSDQRRDDANNGAFSGGYATYGQLRTLSGIYHYQQTNVPISDGYYNIFLALNAGARTLFAPDTRIEVNTSTVSGKAYSDQANSYLNIASDQIVFGSVRNHDVPGGPANGGGSNGGENSLVGSGCGGSGVCDFDLILGLVNKNGLIAGGLTHQLTILNDQNVALFSGSGSGDRLDGALAADPNKLPDGDATFAQLRTQSVGQYYYSSQRPLSSGGDYNLSLNIDFGQRTIGGGNSKLLVNGPIAPSTFAGTVALASASYADLSGTASYQKVNTASVTGGLCGTACTSTFNFTAQNIKGILGGSATHSLEIKNSGGSVIATGSGTPATTERRAGLAP